MANALSFTRGILKFFEIPSNKAVEEFKNLTPQDKDELHTELVKVPGYEHTEAPLKKA